MPFVHINKSENRNATIVHYIKLLRIKHYLKNILIFAPLFFGFMDKEEGKTSFPTIYKTFYAYILFCLCSSIVYIINDMNDMNYDRKHPVKRHRPIASGVISICAAKVFLVSLCLIVIGMSTYVFMTDMFDYAAIIWLLGYVIINLVYSLGGKNIPIMDIVILASCFVIRLYYGSVVAQIEVSPWLYLTVLGGAFYLGMGKRRNEIKNQPKGDTRHVLKKYNYDFLDKNMHICAAFTEMAYALWTIQHPNKMLLWTVPLVMVIFMKYSLNIESEDSNGNPIDVMLSDKILIGLGIVYIIIMVICIYVM